MKEIKTRSVCFVFLTGVIFLGLCLFGREKTYASQYNADSAFDYSETASLQIDDDCSGQFNDWNYIKNGDMITLTDYTGSDKDVVIPNSGELGVTTVNIIPEALRDAGQSANNGAGSLTISKNGGKVVVAEYSLNGTFRNLQYIRDINLSRLDTSNVKGMNWMFSNCSSLMFSIILTKCLTIVSSLKERSVMILVK